MMRAAVGERWDAARSGLRGATVDLIRAPLECVGEAAKHRFEHRAHDHPEGAALELVQKVELDLAGALAGGAEAPAVLQPAERSAEIVDDDLQLVAIERDL